MAEVGPRVGLVLGAGGIRGCAHPAVIRVLRAAGIPIDLVVGASVGAMFALGVAAGLSPERLSDTALSVTPLEMVRFYLGRLRPTRYNPIGRLLLDAGQGKDFSDLALPLGIAATDVASHQPVLLHQGPVLPAVQASIALPLLARSVTVGGRMLLDGGLVETLPVAFARALGADLVIAVCLGHNYHAPGWLGRSPRAITALQRLGQQRHPPRIGLSDQLRFSCRLWAGSVNPPPPAGDADLLIWPDFGHLSPNSPVGARFCYQQGYAAALEALPALESLLGEIRAPQPSWHTLRHHQTREEPL